MNFFVLCLDELVCFALILLLPFLLCEWKSFLAVSLADSPEDL